MAAVSSRVTVSMDQATAKAMDRLAKAIEHQNRLTIEKARIMQDQFERTGVVTHDDSARD